MRQMTLDQIDLEGNGFHEALNAFIISHTIESPGRAEPSNFCLISSASGANCAAKSFPDNATVVVIRRDSARDPTRPRVFLDMQTKSALDFRRVLEYLRELMTTLSARNNGVNTSITRIMKGAQSQVSVPNEYSPCAATPLPPGAPRSRSTK